MGGNAFTSFGVTGPFGGWIELGRTTLGATNANIDVTSLPDKRYYMILADLKYTASLTPWLRLNSVSTGTPYADRYADNGVEATPNVSQNQILLNSATTTPTFSVGYAGNLSSKEKLINALHTIEQSTAGAGTAPDRRELFAKDAQTSNPISAFNLAASTSTFASGSEFVILGWSPPDTHTTNFWEELASVELGSSSATIDSGVFTAKKYIWIQYRTNQASATANVNLKVGNTTIDTGTNYSYRRSIDGATDATFGNQVGFFPSPNQENFGNLFVVNNASNEKLFIAHSIEAATAGAANAPNRTEVVAKWTNTSNQFDRVELTAGGTYGVGSILKIWGGN